MINQNTTIYDVSVYKKDAEKKIIDAIKEFTEKTGLAVYRINFEKESFTEMFNDEERVCYYNVNLEVRL